MNEYIKEKLENMLFGIKRGIVYTMLLFNIGNITEMEKIRHPSLRDDEDKPETIQTPPKDNEEEKIMQVVEKVEIATPVSVNTPPKVKKVEIKEIQNNEFYAECSKSSEDSKIRDRAKEFYSQICKGHISDYVLLEDLLKSEIGIEDICFVLSENPNKMTNIIPGRSNILLAKSASKVKGGGRRECLLGVQRIFDNAGFSGIISGDDKDWPQKIKGCSSNSACNTYIPLEKSGKFIIVTIDNLACDKTRNSVENKKMRALAKKLPIGSIIITDNKIADEHQGRVYTELARVYGKGGKVHGHICVKDIDHVYKSDIVEADGPNFANYGDVVRIAFARDIKIEKDLALDIIEVYQKRKANEFVQNIGNYVKGAVKDRCLSRG